MHDTAKDTKDLKEATAREERTDEAQKTSSPFAGKKVDQVGLCWNCAHASSCCHAKDSKQLPMYYCEEYEVTSIQRATVTDITPEDEEDEPPTETLVGICRTCQNRTSCWLRKDSDIIWQCEEFE